MGRMVTTGRLLSHRTAAEKWGRRLSGHPQAMQPQGDRAPNGRVEDRDRSMQRRGDGRGTLAETPEPGHEAVQGARAGRDAGQWRWCPPQ